MAPSRGSSDESRPEGSLDESASQPPTLRPYLDKLPPLDTHVTDLPTPTARRFASSIDRDASATPTPLHPSAVDPEDADDDGVDIGDDESLGENEEEFQQHYSRNSPASSEDDEGEDDEDPTLNNGSAAFSNINPDRLQRVTSLPLSGTSPGLQRPTLPHSQSTVSLRAPPPPPPLYPPFYNRPPTPLPPSPSLTSLLRPPSILNRSTTSTRPTTPDSSDVETPLDTEAAVAHSARRAHPLPPASPKVPTYEYYGFVLYLASSLAFLMYILWSYLPSPFLHALGITYYPNRWWSLAIPAWIVMLLVWIYVALLSFNVEYLTLSLSSVECMVDDAANVAVLDERGRIRKGGSKRLVREVELRRALDQERRNASWGRKAAKGRAAKKQKEREREKRKGGAIELSDLEEDWLTYVSLYGPGNGDRGMDLSWKQIWNQGTDGVMDVPLGGVCEVLYGED
ncbi:uncharacterized protein HMPREF1541_01873 [Cyphellophora europaea CBS 101466]|uniref:PIG-P domain-containing protein n=1 Tax=Cyphellophora europaea (strain CBS 101466) TaxID=1220924 RepID=W2S2A1_CYPE1|nr:uncharacterized protein HMPREF1541_01873 [Cyphellophora europaea CBS 101466]ETN42715.1 hypothetical protein HMPREF1541_01873 [Cyphellophora europaea CBS 101466]